MLDSATRAARKPPEQAAEVLAVRGVSAEREGRLALKDVSLTLAAGRTLALVGPNGGGKTTLLRAILGLLPCEGEVRLCGVAPGVAIKRGDVVGYVPQNPQVPAGLPLTAKQAVRLAVSGRAGFLRRPRAEDLAWADEMLARLAGEDAAELARMAVTKLSGGQLQQVFLARALANRPRLLILDEPTIGLDRSASGRLIGLLRELRGQGMAMLIATHDHLTAMAVADDLIYLDVTVQYHGAVDGIPAHLDARLCHHDHRVEAQEKGG